MIDSYWANWTYITKKVSRSLNSMQNVRNAFEDQFPRTRPNEETITLDLHLSLSPKES